MDLGSCHHYWYFNQHSPSEGLTDLHLLTLYMKAALNSLSPQLQVFIFSPRLVLAMSGPTSCQVLLSSL